MALEEWLEVIGLLPAGPNREHIHAVGRTPNGSDYGKDLLRQYYQAHSHESR